MRKKTPHNLIKSMSDGELRRRGTSVGGADDVAVAQTPTGVRTKYLEHSFTSFGAHPNDNPTKIKLGRNVTLWRSDSNLVVKPSEHQFEHFPTHPGENRKVIQVGKVVVYKENTDGKVAEWPAALANKKTHSAVQRNKEKPINRMGLFSSIQHLFRTDKDGHGPLARLLMSLRFRRESSRNTSAMRHR